MTSIYKIVKVIPFGQVDTNAVFLHVHNTKMWRNWNDPQQMLPHKKQSQTMLFAAVEQTADSSSLTSYIRTLKKSQPTSDNTGSYERKS